MKIKGLLVMMALAFAVINCTKEKAEEIVEEPVVLVDTTACADSISYAQEVKAMILTPNCNTSGCHNASSAGGFNLLNHQTVAANAALIYSVISHEPGSKFMPLGGDKLSEELIEKFKCWMDQGKLDN